MLPKAVFTAAVAVGLTCALVAAGLLTWWAPAAHVGGEVTPSGVLVTDPGVTALTGGRLTIEVTGGAGAAFVGSARQVDADAWVGSSPATRITGLAEDGSPATRAQAGEEAVSDPAAADLWTEFATGPAPLAFVVDDPRPGDAVVVVAPAASVLFRWEREATHPVAWPLLATGTLLVLWGVPGLVRRNRLDRRRLDRRQRMSRSQDRHRDLATWAVLLTTAMTAAGCAAPPAPVAPASVASPALTAPQARRVLGAVAGALAGPGEERLTGPALEWRQGAQAGAPAPEGGGAWWVGEFARTAGAAAADGPGDRALLLPRTDGWPRSFAALVPAQADGVDGVLAVLVAEGPREPYRLWAALPVAGTGPDSPWPAPEQGAEPVGPPPVEAGDESGDASADGADVAEIVAAVTERFSDVLAQGDASVHAPEFGADPVSAGVRTRTEQLAADTRPALVETAHAPSAASPVLTLLDSSGAAVVATAVTTTATVTPRPAGAVVTVPPDLVGLAGAPAAPASLEVTSTAALVFVVPAERGNIGTLAAADGITSAAAS